MAPPPVRREAGARVSAIQGQNLELSFTFGEQISIRLSTLSRDLGWDKWHPSRHYRIGRVGNEPGNFLEHDDVGCLVWKLGKFKGNPANIQKTINDRITPEMVKYYRNIPKDRLSKYVGTKWFPKWLQNDTSEEIQNILGRIRIDEYGSFEAGRFQTNSKCFLRIGLP